MILFQKNNPIVPLLPQPAKRAQKNAAKTAFPTRRREQKKRGRSRAKGKIKSGCIHGKQRIFENNGKNFRTWDDETIHTELFETTFGKEMEITNESDVGEYGEC